MKTLAIKQACQVLNQGGIIAYPTEAVFGLGCDPQNESALLKIVQLKHRSAAKGLILVASDFQQLAPYLAPLAPEIYNRVMQSWPGPTTWLLPANSNAPKILRGDHTLQAVRVSAHPVVRCICETFGSAIVSTSANTSGHKPAKTALKTRIYFKSQIDFIIHDKLGELRNPSVIKNAITGEILRPG